MTDDNKPAMVYPTRVDVDVLRYGGAVVTAFFGSHMVMQVAITDPDEARARAATTFQSTFEVECRCTTGHEAQKITVS